MVDSDKYGFVGLGDMGGPMAANLARGGFQLIVYDKAGTENLAPSGTEIGAGIKDVARAAQIVFVSVPDAAASLEVARSLVAVENRNTQTLVNLSTVGVEATGSIVKTLADFGIDYVDAPVSGGRAGAIRGTVTVMWSGSAERMEFIRPVLDSFAGSVFFVGPTPGQGQAMKLLNNYLSAVAMTATSEAIVFGLSHSLDMKTMLDVANVSTGQNSATQDKFPNRILTSTYDAGFRMALMDKDVALYLSEAKSAGTPASLCEQVATYWQKGMKQFPDGDFTEIFKVIRGEID
jgi:3-hydroxyisobutyrate dehydrogenase-like beta-hydroxyacid dehydrogenase|tara:strand:- start:68 stop:940 length:873 start_codon:yes stop_codon:yes gene_type:complete